MNQNLFLKQDYCFGIVTFENLFNVEILVRPIQIYYFQTHLLYFNGIYKFEGIKDENGTVSETTNSSQRKESLAEIGVYFQSLNKKLVFEEPKYTVSFSFEPRRPCRIASLSLFSCIIFDISSL